MCSPVEDVLGIRDWRDLPGPNWFSGAEIYRRFVASVTGTAVAVELGAWKGRSALCMGAEIARSGKRIRFFAVDHWQGSPGETQHEQDADVREGRLYEMFLGNIAALSSYVEPIRDDTAASARHFEDGSVDFLYVDASHTYAGVLADLIAWFPKVKVGGLIAGDDWCFATKGEFEVRAAVLDFFGSEAAHLSIERGSAPNENWLQWSIVKRDGFRAPTARELLWRRHRTAAKHGTRRLLRKLRPRV